MSDLHSPADSIRPFVATPDASRYFPSAVAEEARQRISRAVARGEGPALLIGAAGTGKSLLLEVLGEQFRDLREVVPLSGGQICTRRSLLQTILFQLDLPYRDMDEGELRLSLLDYLEPGESPSRRLLLLVDEADSLPLRLLEELRSISNVARSGETLVSLVMAGSPNLEEQFADPQLTAFSQRLSTRCYLAPLGREETFQYVRAQVAATSMDPDALFARDGLEAIFGATDGIPRLVNQLGDQLVWMAQDTGQTPLDGQIVQQAWSELQQLPAPWNTPTVSAPTEESVIEFGELSSEDVIPADESEEDLPASIPISFQPHIEAEISETLDSAELLIEQIEQHDSGITVPLETAAPLAHDPFHEAFGSEEIVLDQYLAFECELLATAPRVINRLDTAFACQLLDITHQEDPVELARTSSEPESLDPVTFEPAAIEDVEFDTELDSVEEEEMLLAADSHPTHDPGDLLVIEDEGRPQMQIVQGRQFRQLFSTLQSQSRLG